MKRTLLLVVALVVASSQAAYAQQAPDRAGAVASIVSRNTRFFTGDDGRRELLKVIVCELNKADNGNWGRLSKDDRAGFIPADILVWRPTLDHFDVLTDTGAMWNPDGRIQASWSWSVVDCGDVQSPIAPATPGPAPGPSVDLQPLVDRMGVLEHSLANVNAMLQQLVQAIQDEVEERVSHDTGLGQQLEELQTRKVPSGCIVQFLRCRLTP